MSNPEFASVILKCVDFDCFDYYGGCMNVYRRVWAKSWRPSPPTPIKYAIIIISLDDEDVGQLLIRVLLGLSLGAYTRSPSLRIPGLHLEERHVHSPLRRTNIAYNLKHSNYINIPGLLREVITLN